MKRLLTSFGVYPLILFIALCVLAFIIPPFQKADETVHFFRAFTVATGQFQCQTSKTWLAKRVYEFPSMLATSDIIMKQNNKFAIGLLKQSYPYRVLRSEVTYEFTSCFLPAIAYIPYAVPIFLLSPFDNLLVIFYGMRVVSLLLFFFSFVISLSLIPKKYKLILILFSLLPMVLHQGTAISYDAMSISLSMITVSIFLHMLNLKQKTWGMWILFTILLIVMNLVKSGYYATLLLPFIVFPVKISFVEKIILCICGIGIGLLVVNISASISYYLYSFFSSVQEWLVLTNPIHFISVLITSFMEEGGYYLKSTIGIFGWLDYELPVAYYFFISFITGVIIFKLVIQENKPLSISTLLILTGALILNILLIFFHFYVAVTPIGYYKIIGVQGRYFLPLLPLFIYCFVQWILYMKRFPQIVLIVMGTITIVVLFSVVYDRYYNYQTFYANPAAIENDIKQGIVLPNYLSPILINKSMNFKFSIEKGKKLVGFQLLLDNQKTINVLYTYTLKDRDCEKILISGYFDHIVGKLLSHLKQDIELPYTQPLPITSITADHVCLTINPIRFGEQPIFMSALGESGTLVIRFLYVRQ